jgi:hypothetical protein
VRKHAKRYGFNVPSPPDKGAAEFGAAAAIVYIYAALNRPTKAQYPDDTFFAYTYVRTDSASLTHKC